MITLRVLDMNGNPMAGGTVTLYQSVYAWAPPCPARGRCAQPQLLARADIDRHIRAGRNGKLYAGFPARNRNQADRSGGHRQFQHA